MERLSVRHKLTLIGVAAAALCCAWVANAAQEQRQQHHSEAEIEQLQEPLYNPFVERYVLDELKALRQSMNDHRIDVTEQLTDRQITAVDKAVTYSYETVTYFFYLIAGVSSLLVIVGWNSLREIKAKVHSEAGKAVDEIVEKYEARLQSLERKLQSKSEIIEANREEIERTQERHALWLRARQESNPGNKIAIYDQILELAPDDCEALIYKADAVLEMNETQWAISLCHNALATDPENAQAFYQLACAYSLSGQLEESSQNFLRAVAMQEAYREELNTDPALEQLRAYEPLHAALADPLLVAEPSANK